ncbi:MAG: HlyD family secretion protein [Blastocatellia bacterium]|nr:HlyD family secretion protein [Blastocatellia bacterium]
MQKAPPQSLQLVKTPPAARSVARILIVFALTITLGLVFVPWQQSVTGAGRVIVFSPMDRPQNIEAQIPGRLVSWKVVEGQTVKGGELIAELTDLDSKFLDPEQPRRLQAQKEALLSRKAAAEVRATALEKQIAALTGSREAAVPAAMEKALQTQDRLKAAEQSLQAAEQSFQTAKLNLERIQELNTKGLRSQRDRELADLDFVRTRTEVERAKAALEVARRDTTVGNLDQQKVDNDTVATLSSVQASLASVRETIASVNSDLIKLEVDIQNLDGRVAQRRVVAPRDGRVVRLMKVGAGETVKSGDVLAVLAPTTTDQAVELMLSDNDAPLVSVGRHVRLQFAGWPALQFTGWPSVAVGTFGGKVSVIDAVDDGKSRYRVVIVPDQETIAAKLDEPWPSNQYLRPGAEVVGWVMLDTVSLGFELWRQFNAFPPTVSREAAYSDPTAKPKETKSDSKDEK